MLQRSVAAVYTDRCTDPEFETMGRTRATSPVRASTSRASTRKEKAKGKRPAEPSSPHSNDSGSPRSQGPPKAIAPKPTYAELYKKFMGIKLAPTRFADHTLLRELGILDDVRLILSNMGLEQFFNMAYPTHQIPTCQFLASLKATFYDPNRHREGDNTGLIEFKVSGKTYKVTFSELGEVYGLQEGLDTRMRMHNTDAHLLWHSIGINAYEPGLVKSSHVSHPAIRYVHKFLAHTFFARRETGAITEDEIALLLYGLKPLLGTFDNKQRIYADNKNVNMVAILVNQLMHYQDWVWTTTDRTPQISIGGIVTPILASCGVNLGAATLEPARIDAFYLNRAHFLVGQVGTSYAYRYPGIGYGPQRILLPQPALTTILDRSNIRFFPPAEANYNADIHPPLESISRRRAPTRTSSSSTAYTEIPPTSERVYGSERYHFTPYDCAIPNVAVRQAHRQVHLLQRWNKWQDRTIKKLVKSVKGLKSQIKDLKRTFKGPSSSHQQHAEIPEVAEDSEESMDVDRRHSYHGGRSELVTHQEPRRHSTHEPRRARRTPTPESSNPSLHISSSDSSGSPQF